MNNPTSRSPALLFFGAIMFMCLGAVITLVGVGVWGQISSPSTPAQAQATALSPTTSLPQSPRVSSSPTRIWNAVGNKPVIGKNFVFVITSKGTAAALDLNSGQQKWETEFQVNALFEMGGTLVVVRPDARIYGMNENNGDVKWKYLLPNDYTVGGTFPQQNILAVYTTKVWDCRMIGLDSQTGQETWGFPCQTHGDDFVSLWQGQALRWGCGYGCNSASLLDLNTGARTAIKVGQPGQYQEVQPFGFTTSSLIAWKDSPEYAVVSIDLGTGNVKWKTPRGSGAEVRGNTVYRFDQSSSSYEGKGTVFDADSGKEKWTWDMGTIGKPIGSFPDVVYFQSYRGIFYALNAQTGTTLWQNDEIVASSVITQTQDTVYITTANAIVSLDTKAGKRRWKYDTEPVSSTAIGGRILYWSNTRLFFLDDTGKQTWSQNLSGIAQIMPLSNGFLTVGNNGISLFR